MAQSPPPASVHGAPLCLDADLLLDALASRLEEESASRTGPGVSDATLAAMAYAFGSAAEKGLDIAHRGNVSCVVGERSGRKVYQVAGTRAGSFGGGGTHAVAHTCLPREMCTCHVWAWDVAYRNESAVCKHQLACRVAEACRLVRSSTPIADADLAALLAHV